MTSVAIVTAVYPPEPVVSSQMGRDLAEHLAHGGAQTTVICPYPTRPDGVDYLNHRKASGVREDIESGVNVVRLPSFTAPRSRLLTRMFESWSFGRHACRFLEHQEVEVVYANTWPLLSQALLALYCTRKRIPLVLHIQDVYPESLLGKLPVLARGVVGRPLRMLDRWCAQQAARVVVISEGMRRTYLESRGLPPEKVITVFNWVDEQRFQHATNSSHAHAQYGIPEGKFTFLYLGNIGPVAGVELLIEAFHKARLYQAQLVIAGDGSAKAKCIELAKLLGTNNIHFVPCVDVRNVPALQSMANVLLLPMRKGEGMSSIPSKLPAYMFSAKPVLATLDAGSDTARFIQEAQCGWVGEPENLIRLTVKMSEVSVLPTTALEAMGQRGRQYALAHFGKAYGVRRLASIILNAAVGSGDNDSRRDN